MALFQYGGSAESTVLYTIKFLSFQSICAPFFSSIVNYRFLVMGAMFYTTRFSISAAQSINTVLPHNKHRANTNE